MASGDKEHKMLFDIRGKRRNVVKVVYAILALLMGLSLLILAGPGIGNLFNGGGEGSEAASQLEDQAARIERKLVKDPENPDLLLSLTRTQVATANALSETNPTTGEALLTVESRQQFEKASATWSAYLEATDEPSAGGAQLISPALFSLAQTSRTSNEAEANIKAAAEAQGILAEQRPSLGSLSTFALYTLYTFDYKGAEKALNEAKGYANSKFERQNLENQFEEIEKRAREFQKQLVEANKAAKQGGAGPESLQNPLGGLGGGSTLSE
ncbi:MAG: hypothetical protein WD810_08720 [Solirubrobacterales bacterium]